MLASIVSASILGLPESVNAAETTSGKPVASAKPDNSGTDQRLLLQYTSMLKELQADISKALPALDEKQIAAFKKARESAKAANVAVAATQKPLDQIAGAKGLVEHAKGKWIGGAEKGIAAAEASLKKATTSVEREAAQKDLEKWQANKADGLKALSERQAALDAAIAEEAKHIQESKAAKDALNQALADELASAKKLLAKAETFLGSDTLDATLVKCAVLANATPKGLSEFAQKGKEQEALVAQLLSDTALMKQMLEAGGAKDGMFGPAMQIYTAIQHASSRASEGVFQRLALATCLEHAVPIAQSNPTADTNAPPVVDPVKRYLHFEKAYLSGELDAAFKDLSAWELRNVVNGDEPDAILAWGRETLRNYRPDHVLNANYGWRYSAAVTTDVRYGSQNVKDDLPSLQNYQNIIKNGGICGRRAFFGRFILRSFGIPTVARPQRAHAALARWTPKGWVINLGAGWGYRDAKGVFGMTDADFVMETQVRKQPKAHVRSLRAEWAGDALGEQKYVSLKPNTGGLWNLLALFEKKNFVAEAKPDQLAALGEDLGEANESAETRAKALVTAEVKDEDKKVVTAPNGVITIPAAACGGAQIVGSFQGGHQLFSGGGVITCDFDVLNPGKYAVLARVVTVQDNPDLQLTVNGAKEAVAITVPYSVGKWQQTELVQVTLVAGKNGLRFARPEGSRGLTIKEFTLTPVR